MNGNLSEKVKQQLAKHKISAKQKKEFQMKAHEPTEYEQKLLEQEKLHKANKTREGECEQMGKIPVLNPDYYESLEKLWFNATQLMEYTTNPLGEIYRLSRIVQIFATNCAKIDALRTQLGEAEKKHDIYMIKRIAFLAKRYQEEKAFEGLWQRVADEYDRICETYIEQCNNDNIRMQIPTSEEIMDKCVSYFAESRENQYNVTLDSVKADLGI